MKISKEIDHKGGVEVSSTDPDSHSNRLVHIQYKDHIEFKNTNHKLYFDVNVREAVGWLVPSSGRKAWAAV